MAYKKNIALTTGATFTGDIIVPAEAYDATAWNGSNEVPTKNDIRDKIETLSGGDPSYSPGSITIATETGQVRVKTLKLTTTQRLTVAGTGRLRIT